MHSWIFRHHDELCRLYGRLHAEPRERTGRSGSGPTPVPKPALPSAANPDGRHGQVIRRARYVVIQPMPPR